MGRRKKFLWGALCVALAACSVNPVTGKSELSFLSEERELAMGSEAYPVYTQAQGGALGDAPLQAYVTRVGKSLAAHSERPALPFEFNVLNDSSVNAFALPGGKISITRGLLGRMENEAQLAAVLGHEIGHVTARHAAAGYTRQVLAGLAIAVGGVALEAYDVDRADLIVGGSALATGLILLKYSRDQERQSDELGIRYMAAAGYNPEGAVQVMEILNAAAGREPSTLEGMMSSHPLTGERIRDTAKLSENYPAARTPEGFRRESFAEATQGLRRVMPAYEKADRAQALLKKKKNGEAAALLREAVAEAPGEARIQLQLATAEWEAGNRSAAEEAAARAVELDPGLFDARHTAGMIAFKAQRYADGVEAFDAADKIVSGEASTAFFRGRCHEELGQRDKAARDYRAVLKTVRKGPMAEHAAKRLKEWETPTRSPAPTRPPVVRPGGTST